MPTDIVMPKVGGYDVQNATLVRWHKQEGETVQVGEILSEIESDKATLELPAPVAGILLRILITEGTNVPVGTVLAIVGQPGESADVGIPSASHGEREAAKSQDHSKASPLARKLAAQWQIDLGQVHGTGPEGRITREDIERAHEQQVVSPAAAHGTADSAPDGRVPLSKMRRAIAQRMTLSATSVPHFTVVSEIDMQAALALRMRLNALPGDAAISVTDMVVRAAALSLRSFAALNTSYAGDELVLHQAINIGIAVMLEAGLVTPVIHQADQKSLADLAKASQALVARARAGRLQAEDLSDGTFTISNLGMFDVEHFLPIINPPEAAILAVATIREVAVVVKGKVKPRQRMNLALTVDHRVADGALAARFLQEMKALLEDPLRLLA